MDAKARKQHEDLLRESYRRVVGKELYAGEDLFAAPGIVCSHNTNPDPVFTYGNQAALNLFEMSWDEFTALPSRLSAEPVHQSERRRLLEAVSAKGFIDEYGGVRISSTGKRFQVTGATVWNVIDEQGRLRGQAAIFPPPRPIVETPVAPLQGLPKVIRCRYCQTPLVRRQMLDVQKTARRLGSTNPKVLSGIFMLLDGGYETDEPRVVFRFYRCPNCYYTELFTPPTETGYKD